jgi:hypothetical protein
MRRAARRIWIIYILSRKPASLSNEPLARFVP